MIAISAVPTFRRAVVAGATALALLPSVAGATHREGGDGGTRDFAVGGGFTGSESGDPLGAQHVGFAAFGGPTTFDLVTGFGGDPVTGHFRAGGEFVDPSGSDNEVGEFQQEGPVTCLAVNGNTARLVYPLKRARPEANEVNEVLIILEDNGPPVDGESQDRIAFEILPDVESPASDPPSEQDSECVPEQNDRVLLPLTRGNFTIHDAP